MLGTLTWPKTEKIDLNTDFVVEFDTWAKQFLDLTFCRHSNASSEYSGQNNWLIFVCAISKLGYRYTPSPRVTRISVPGKDSVMRKPC